MGRYSLEDIYLVLEGYWMAVCENNINLDRDDFGRILKQLGVENEEEITEIILGFGLHLIRQIPEEEN